MNKCNYNLIIDLDYLFVYFHRYSTEFIVEEHLSNNTLYNNDFAEF